MKRWGVVGAHLLMLLMINLAHATSLGVQGDAFMATFISWIPTVLFLAMLIGIAVWLQASSDYNQGMLSGSASLVTRGLVGGGAIAILAALGFSQGALLH